MKRKKFLLNVLAGVVIAVSCSSCSDGASSGKIIMTTRSDVEFSCYLTGSGEATVDLGDGAKKIPSTLSELGVGITLSPKESNAPNLTITFTGDSIKGVKCKGITSLDVSRYPKLKELTIENSQLTNLDVSHLTELEELTFNDCQLTSLDMRKNTALTVLRCERCELTSLDVSKNLALNWLLCNHNELTSLDVSKNTALTFLDCSWNELSSSALNELFESLPTVEDGELKIWANPGEDDCDQSIATNKGWKVGYW